MREVSCPRYTLNLVLAPLSSSSQTLRHTLNLSMVSMVSLLGARLLASQKTWCLHWACMPSSPELELTQRLPCVS